MTNEPVEKGKKRTRKRVRDLERMHQDQAHPVPGHADALTIAGGYSDAMNQEKPDECKSAADMAGPAERARGGNPVSVQDYNAQRDGTSSRRVAVGHPDLRQQPATVFQGILAALRTTNPYSYVGQAGFSSAFGHTDRPAEAPGDTVSVAGYDLAGSAGSYAGMGDVDISARRSEGYGQHRDSATPSNGSHNLSNVTSHAVASKSRIDIMKECLFNG